MKAVVRYPEIMQIGVYLVMNPHNNSMRSNFKIYVTF